MSLNKKYLFGFAIFFLVTAGIIAVADLTATISKTNVEVILQDKTYNSYINNSQISQATILNGTCKSYLIKDFKPYALIEYDCNDKLTDSQITTNRNNQIVLVLDLYIKYLNYKSQQIANQNITIAQTKGLDGELTTK